MIYEGVLTEEYKVHCLKKAGFESPYLNEYVGFLSEDEFWYFMWGLTSKNEGMGKHYCEGLHCPIQTTCIRFTDKPKTGIISIFTEIPGRMITFESGDKWVCDMIKQKEENEKN